MAPKPPESSKIICLASWRGHPIAYCQPGKRAKFKIRSVTSTKRASLLHHCKSGTVSTQLGIIALFLVSKTKQSQEDTWNG